MYKEASKQKLRVQTDKGSLSVEQLWELSLTELDSVAVNLEKEYKNSGKKSYLVSKSKKDKTLKLKFDIVLDILTNKVEDVELSSKARETKEHNAKILALIANKQEEGLKDKSVEELTELLK